MRFFVERCTHRGRRTQQKQRTQRARSLPIRTVGCYEVLTRLRHALLPVRFSPVRLVQLNADTFLQRAHTMRILLVEDDAMIGDAAEAALRDLTHVVDRATDGLTALTLAATTEYQLVLLDLGLPKLDGMEVLSKLRARSDVPVIILTARDALEDRLRGLDAGADDYLVKPFHMSELMARVRALMRRRNGTVMQGPGNGVVTLDEETKTARTKDGKTVTLSRREYALLSVLLARPGAILSRRTLEERIYTSGEEPESNAIEFLIHSLRKKLGTDTVKNVRGLGWRVAPREADAS